MGVEISLPLSLKTTSFLSSAWERIGIEMNSIVAAIINRQSKIRLVRNEETTSRSQTVLIDFGYNSSLRLGVVVYRRNEVTTNRSRNNVSRPSWSGIESHKSILALEKEIRNEKYSIV